jgi:hypothetical protein
MALPESDFYRQRLAQTDKQSTEIRLIRRSAFIERYVLAVAYGGSVPNLEFDLDNAGKLFDAIYPEESQ